MIGLLAAPSDRPALVTADGTLSYSDLHARVRHGAARWSAVAGLPPGRALAFLLARNDLPTVLALLSLRAAGHVVALLDGGLAPELLDGLLEAYQPELVVRGADVEVRASRAAVSDVRPLHDVLGLCLATSGSTGSPKFVRLAESAVVANARAIAQALAITPDDRAITCLPLHYVYGLSILTSHLAAGASVVLTDSGVMSPDFWPLVRAHGVTALAGVPYSYEMMERLGFARVVPPGVRTMTQAGGKLADAAVLRAHAFMHERGGRFHVMYGQTEATARIAVMPHAWLPERVGAAGRAVPGGTIEAQDEQGQVLPAGAEGEIVYRGPNVMLGYATSRDDLALGDVQGGVLRTGDIGSVSEDGCLRITGRLKRMGKLFGVRIDLDEVEQFAAADGPAAVVEGSDRLVLFTASDETVPLDGLKQRVAARLRVQQRVIDVRRVAELPRTASGKIDYPRLRAAL